MKGKSQDTRAISPALSGEQTATVLALEKRDYLDEQD